MAINIIKKLKDNLPSIFGFVFIAFALFFVYVSLKNNNRTSKIINVKSNTSKKDTANNATVSTASNNNINISKNSVDLTVDSLTRYFSGPPYNYTFKEEIKLRDSTATYAYVRGYENIEGQKIINNYGYNTNSYEPDKIKIWYDYNSGIVQKVILQLNHLPTHEVKINHLKKIFQFMNYFDPNAKNYYIKNFYKCFYNKDAYENLDLYTNKNKTYTIGIEHQLYVVRKLEKENGYPCSHYFVSCFINLNPEFYLIN